MSRGKEIYVGKSKVANMIYKCMVASHVELKDLSARVDDIPQSLNHKFKRNTDMKYQDVKQMLNALGYTVSIDYLGVCKVSNTFYEKALKEKKNGKYYTCYEDEYAGFVCQNGKIKKAISDSKDGIILKLRKM